MTHPRRASQLSTGTDIAPEPLHEPRADEALVAAARQAQASAYAPYSGFRVGAAVRTAAGNVYIGCNVENASYGLAICAERAAVFAAVAAEGPHCQILAIAVFADTESCAPCGACRQVLAEFGPDAATTFLVEGRYVTRGLAELLPYQFSLRDGLQ